MFATGKKCHRQCVQFVAKKRLLPKSFKTLLRYVLLMQKKRQQAFKVKKHRTQDLTGKAVSALKSNVIWRTQSRKLNEELLIHYKKKLRARTFKAWTQGVFKMQELKAKRYCFTRIISEVDGQWTVRRTFEALKAAARSNKIADAHKTRLVHIHRRLKLFKSWRQATTNIKHLDLLKRQVEQLHQETRNREILKVWSKRAKAFTRAKQMALAKLQACLFKGFKCLRLAVHRRKAVGVAKLWHDEQMKRAFV